MKSLALFAAASTLAFAAHAQGPVGVLQDVQGAVTVSSTQSVKRAVNGTAVAEGASVLVASNGAATLVMNNGCVVSLKGSQHMAVNSKAKCAEVQASVKQLFSPYQVAQAPVGGGITPPPPASTSSTAGSASMATGAGFGSGAVAVGVLGAAGLLAAVESSRNDSPASAQ